METSITADQLTATPAPTPEPLPTTKVVKDGYILERVSYAADSDAAGFAFYSIEYTDIDKAVAKVGKDNVLAAFNSAIRSALRTKGKAQLSESKDSVARAKENADILAKTPGGVLVTEVEAESFVPGQRGVTSPASLYREAKLAAKEGRKDEAIALFKLFKEASDREMAELAGLTA